VQKNLGSTHKLMHYLAVQVSGQAIDDSSVPLGLTVRCELRC